MNSIAYLFVLFGGFSIAVGVIVAIHDWITSTRKDRP